MEVIKKKGKGFVFACLTAAVLVSSLQTAFAEPAAMYPEKKLALEWLSQP